MLVINDTLGRGIEISGIAQIASTATCGPLSCCDQKRRAQRVLRKRCVPQCRAEDSDSVFGVILAD